VKNGTQKGERKGKVLEYKDYIMNIRKKRLYKPTEETVGEK